MAWRLIKLPVAQQEVKLLTLRNTFHIFPALHGLFIPGLHGWIPELCCCPGNDGDEDEDDKDRANGAGQGR